MANPLRGEVELPIKGDDGRPLILGFDINRMCELEAMYPGQSTVDLADKVNQGFMHIIRAFTWAGLRSYNYTLQEAGDVAHEMTPIVAGPLILQAMAKAFPLKKAGEDGGAAADPQTAPAETPAGAGIGNGSSNDGARSEATP